MKIIHYFRPDGKVISYPAGAMHIDPLEVGTYKQINGKWYVTQYVAMYEKPYLKLAWQSANIVPKNIQTMSLLIN
jgi:hypothetical protein